MTYWRTKPEAGVPVLHEQHRPSKPIRYGVPRHDEDHEAVKQARAYAAARNEGHKSHSDYGLSDEDKAIAENTRRWIERSRKRGWWGKK